MAEIPDRVLKASTMGSVEGGRTGLLSTWRWAGTRLPNIPKLFHPQLIGKAFYGNLLTMSEHPLLSYRLFGETGICL